MRLVLSLALAALIGLLAPSVASAADVAHGEQVFSSNCAACHMGGGNVVNAQRTLKQEDLQAYLANYGDGHEEAIAYQVTNGKNGMAAFGTRLSADEIADVAAYVEAQAARGWA
ncbi:c-type cytochrome [Synechococcus sp. RSCCF101]|uniref:c-type cytochrome n=1 Tax=Synechococcus sp. RSCCF101 TaxID=2511069 RepID=UPI0012467F00|nr:c-type cytochrome [Synechococcus sp. RSCCF101]QEY31440.1 c-type cytochrome [Synechococcus sp. RSCCF101]